MPQPIAARIAGDVGSPVAVEVPGDISGYAFRVALPIATIETGAGRQAYMP
jgi:hypothetical protein